MTCTFFGHRDTPMGIRERLRAALIELIDEGVDEFLVGTEGGFDGMAYSVLCELKSSYPQISVSRVLAYLPTKKEEGTCFNENDTIYPEGLESVPRRFAISKRNEWLVKSCDIAVCYIERSQGGAAKFASLAKKKGKRVINLSESFSI